MKPIYIVGGATLITFTACSVLQKKELPKDPRTIGYVSLPTEELAKKSGTPIKDLHIGFGVYLRKCGECHTHALPDDVSKEDWHVITPKMAWNANITDVEQTALLIYILAAKTDPMQPAEQPEIRFQLGTPSH